MKIKKVLRPGQPGTKKWLKKYGDNLLCVRYRYDAIKRRKITSVELIVEEGAWVEKCQKIPRNKIMPIRVSYEETYMRRLVKSAGGKWNNSKKAWEIPYGEILDLGLEDRIVKE